MHATTVIVQKNNKQSVTFRTKELVSYKNGEVKDKTAAIKCYLPQSTDLFISEGHI